MASQVGIANSALIKLGASVIMSFTEGSKNANLCNEQYVKRRDALLRAHNWNFAMARFNLAQLDDAPVFGFDFAYQLPSDWLRTVQVSDNDAGVGRVVYRIEGLTILSNASDIFLRYIKQVTDPNEMDAAFREVLAWDLAVDLAQPITQSTSTQQEMKRGFAQALSQAASVDAFEDFPEEFPESDWVSARN